MLQRVINNTVNWLAQTSEHTESKKWIIVPVSVEMGLNPVGSVTNGMEGMCFRESAVGLRSAGSKCRPEASKDAVSVLLESNPAGEARRLQLLATSSALSVASKVLSSPPRARQIFTVRSLGNRKQETGNSVCVRAFSNNCNNHVSNDVTQFTALISQWTSGWFPNWSEPHCGVQNSFTKSSQTLEFWCWRKLVLVTAKASLPDSLYQI